jgi:peptidoglycan lytic transglycosylase
MVWGMKGGAGRQLARLGAAACCIALAHCSGSDQLRQVDPSYGVAASPRVVDSGDSVPSGGGAYMIGKPYRVGDRVYVPEENKNYRAVGLASWYGPDFHGRQTANGEVFDMRSVSAAHPTLPMPCYVRVTNLTNHRSMIVRVNDRGPFHSNRIIDVSIKVADMLGFSKHGVARVRVEYVSRAPLEGGDGGVLMATLRQGRPAPAPSPIMVAAAHPFVPILRGAALLRGAVPIPPDRPFARDDLN